MPFIVIRGTFHVVGRNKAGTPTGFQPDGDSIQFKPANVKLLDRLRRRKANFQLSAIGSVNLRFEGIDAQEIHYQGHRQPPTLPEQARSFLLDAIGMTGVAFRPDGVTVEPPAQDGQPGYILSRELEVNGRPVSFAFTGTPPGADGAEVVLTPEMLVKSLNYGLMAAGMAYPLFYDSLFHDLRAKLAEASTAARAAQRGVWKTLPTSPGKAGDLDDIETTTVSLYPKLFRRLVDFFKSGQTALADLASWMETHDENDEVWRLPEMNRTHFDNVLKIEGTFIALAVTPEQLVFVSQ